MPKGVKLQRAPAPPEVRCDFCGKRFKPIAWEDRTCKTCQDELDAPSQVGADYEDLLDIWLKKNGRRPKRTKFRDTSKVHARPKV